RCRRYRRCRPPCPRCRDRRDHPIRTHRAGGPTVNLTGSLAAFGLADVFALLATTGKSGALRVHRDGASSGVVWFQDGRVTGASADCARLGLVRRLVGSGAVDDAALRAALTRSASAQVGVARALLEASAVEPELVREAAVDQCVDAIFDLTRWEH